MVHDEVIFIDHAVGVLVDVLVLDRVAVLGVNLLVDHEGVCGLAHDVPCQAGAALSGGKADGLCARCLAVTLELCDLVLVPCDVEAGAPCEVVGHNGLGADGHLDTHVVHRADVAPHHVGGVRCAGRHERQKVGGDTLVPVRRDGDAVVEESEVKTDIPCGGGLPLQVRVVGLRVEGIDPLSASGRVEILVTLLVRVGVDGNVGEIEVHFLLARLTPAETELEVVEDIGRALHEGHVVDLPCECHRGEETPAVLFGETRGAVVAEGECQQIGVVERVVQTPEEADELESVGPCRFRRVLV